MCVSVDAGVVDCVTTGFRSIVVSSEAGARCSEGLAGHSSDT